MIISFFFKVYAVFELAGCIKTSVCNPDKESGCPFTIFDNINVNAKMVIFEM